MLDIGGQEKMRTIWRQHYKKADFIIFVVEGVSALQEGDRVDEVLTASPENRKETNNFEINSKNLFFYSC